ncbi:MAG: type I-E CRISPR-associated protein Cse1/CasA [Polyangiaceae bacterium]|nr:type I-E CRISPR-associated protein Cse1/CasA [Polyangiaceae bacterium]
MSHSHPTFDLTREPWISCETQGGAWVDLGLIDVLVRAHELRSVHDNSPLATAVLHRLLLAALHRIVDGPRESDEWEVLWLRGHFEGQKVNAYFQTWAHRFDLFHQDRPFLQVPALREVLLRERGKEPEPIPASRLALERSYYSGTTYLLEHGGDDAELTPAEAARAMLGFQGFGPGGRIQNDSGYPKGCPLRTGAVVLVLGSNLFETLMLNLLMPAPSVPRIGPTDLPAWEQPQPAQRETRAVQGWLDALTWQARRVQLIPFQKGEQVVVREVITGAGFEPSADWLEPMFAKFVKDVRIGTETIRFDPNRAVWRDSKALYRAVSPGPEERPVAACAQVARLVEHDILPYGASLRLGLYGLSSSQAAITLWRAEQMPLPVRLLQDEDRQRAISGALRWVEDGVAKALREAIWQLAKLTLAMDNRSPDKKDVAALASRLNAQQRYFGAMGAQFSAFVSQVGKDGNQDAALSEWKKTAVREARTAFHEAAEQVGTTARAFQARARAENGFELSIRKLWAEDAPKIENMEQGAKS